MFLEKHQGRKLELWSAVTLAGCARPRQGKSGNSRGRSKHHSQQTCHKYESMSKRIHDLDYNLAVKCAHDWLQDCPIWLRLINYAQLHWNFPELKKAPSISPPLEFATNSSYSCARTDCPRQSRHLQMILRLILISTLRPSGCPIPM
jgi:hypothetical protein